MGADDFGDCPRCGHWVNYGLHAQCPNCLAVLGNDLDFESQESLVAMVLAMRQRIERLEAALVEERAQVSWYHGEAQEAVNSGGDPIALWDDDDRYAFIRDHYRSNARKSLEEEGILQTAVQTPVIPGDS